jgi:hypothetical protein
MPPPPPKESAEQFAQDSGSCSKLTHPLPFSCKSNLLGDNISDYRDASPIFSTPGRQWASLASLASLNYAVQ